MSGARLTRRKIHQPLITKGQLSSARYWVGGNGDWSDDTNHWALTSGGAPGLGNLPDATMSVIFDVNSAGANYTVTTTLGGSCYSIFAGAPSSGFLTLDTGGTIGVYGDDMVLDSTTQFTNAAGVVLLTGTSSIQRIRSNGAYIECAIEVFGGSSTMLLDDLTITANYFKVNGSCTFDTNYYNLTVYNLITASGFSIYLRSSTVTVTGTGVVWDTDHPGSLSQGTSTIKITGTGADKTFDGGGYTFYNLWHSAGADVNSLTIHGYNTFNDFKDTGTAAHSIKFEDSSITTVSTFTVTGNGAGNEISIDTASTTGNHYLVKTGGGQIIRDYLSIQHSVATPSCTWFAGDHSINNQSVATAGSGWYFNSTGVCGSSLLLLLGVG